MSNNSTTTVQFEKSPVCLVLNFLRPLSNHVVLVTTVVNATLMLVAVGGNALILMTIWKNASLRTPSYILLGVLAITDLCTGFITLPAYVIMRVSGVTKNLRIFCVTHSVAQNAGLFFSSITVANIAFMAVERLLHMTRRSIVTKRGVIVTNGIMSLFPLFIVVVSHFYNRTAWMVALSLDFVSITVTSVAYRKLFQLINHHRKQIAVKWVIHKLTPTAVNEVKYKKSVFTILYIMGVFLFSYLPYVICAAVIYITKDVRESTLTVLDICTTVLFASSSMNPFLYYWRMKDIREGVKNLTKCVVSTKLGHQGKSQEPNLRRPLPLRTLSIPKHDHWNRLIETNNIFLRCEKN